MAVDSHGGAGRGVDYVADDGNGNDNQSAGVCDEVVAMLEHPTIFNMERTGYADAMEPAYPRCPRCGGECLTVYKDCDGEFVGCNECLKPIDAWSADICFPDED